MEAILNLIKSYRSQITNKDILLKAAKERKTLARKSITAADDVMVIEQEMIHHRAERQCFIQFISDLESLPMVQDYYDKLEQKDSIWEDGECGVFTLETIVGNGN